MTVKEVINESVNSGLAGAKAMAIQVGTLMPLRTTVNFQYRYGKTTTGAFKYLWHQGGPRRFYKGLVPALFQAPLSRFGDTASNALVLNITQDMELPIWIKTLASSTITSLWRINLMPLDSLKTTMQVEGAQGVPKLIKKVKVGGPSILYHGTAATFAASAVGNWPWFVTYNYLDKYLPEYNPLLRNALMGFSSSVVSDCCSNSIRVVKTVKQTHGTTIPYNKAIQIVLEKDGISGLLGRGLRTKILSNGLQGLTFSVLWKYFQDNKK